MQHNLSKRRVCPISYTHAIGPFYSFDANFCWKRINELSVYYVQRENKIIEGKMDQLSGIDAISTDFSKQGRANLRNTDRCIPTTLLSCILVLFLLSFNMYFYNNSNFIIKEIFVSELIFFPFYNPHNKSTPFRYFYKNPV